MSYAGNANGLAINGKSNLSTAFHAGIASKARSNRDRRSALVEAFAAPILAPGVLNNARPIPGAAPTRLEAIPILTAPPAAPPVVNAAKSINTMLRF
jgi:hypothetical protein